MHLWATWASPSNIKLEKFEVTYYLDKTSTIWKRRSAVSADPLATWARKTAKLQLFIISDKNS